MSGRGFVPGRAVTVTVRDGERIRRRVRAPDEVEGPLPRGTRVGSVSVLVDGRIVRRVPLVTAAAVPEAGTLRVADFGPRRPLDVARRTRHRARRHPPPASPPCAPADRQMIITVTLNAAIDKTLAVPNFRLGRRHRAVEQTAMAGGKGVNVARALKALGQPVIATGVAGGPHRHANRRAPHRGGRSSTTSSASARSRAPRRRWSTRPTASRPRSTSTARTCPRASSSCSSTSCSTSRRAPRCACSPAACRAESTPGSTAGWSRR